MSRERKHITTRWAYFRWLAWQVLGLVLVWPIWLLLFGLLAFSMLFVALVVSGAEMIWRWLVPMLDAVTGWWVGLCSPVLQRLSAGWWADHEVVLSGVTAPLDVLAHVFIFLSGNLPAQHHKRVNPSPRPRSTVHSARRVWEAVNGPTYRTVTNFLRGGQLAPPHYSEEADAEFFRLRQAIMDAGDHVDWAAVDDGAEHFADILHMCDTDEIAGQVYDSFCEVFDALEGTSS